MADCLGAMLLPLVYVTSYVKLQPIEDGDDHDTVAVGGTPLERLGDAGAPGQAAEYNAQLTEIKHIEKYLHYRLTKYSRSTKHIVVYVQI